MNVLVIGSGGREHAMCWLLSHSPSVHQLYAAPGNPGIASVAKLAPIAVDDVSGLLSFAKSNSVDLTIVGPELPLTLGVVDAFESNGLRIFGPSRAAAQMEASKSFAKEIMKAAGVPTASYAVCRSESELRAYINDHGAPLVLKADGLAAGKGVFVCLAAQDFEPATRQLFGSLRADAVVVERFLPGVEVSYIIATDGTNIVPLASSHDYKRIFDQDQGPNTGGMGTVSPSPRLTANQERFVCERIIAPTLAELRKRAIPFKGFLYAGLMIAPDGSINVVEFNARLGDPETQVILRRMQSDLAAVCYALSCPGQEQNGREQNKEFAVEWAKDACVCVVLAAQGYPGEVRKGDEITGIELAETINGVTVFHAGTKRSADGRLVTAGGRVLNVTALAPTIEEARSRAYRACDMIQFQGVQCRRDIGLM